MLSDWRSPVGVTIGQEGEQIGRRPPVTPVGAEVTDPLSESLTCKTSISTILNSVCTVLITVTPSPMQETRNCLKWLGTEPEGKGAGEQTGGGGKGSGTG